MNFRTVGRRLFLGLLACALVAGLALGQGTDSVIVGTVTDPAGALVPNAKITATNKDTNVKYETVSNSAGEYRFNNIPVGRYDVSATAQGFAPATVGDVQLELNRTSAVNLALAVGTVSTTVEVGRRRPPLIQPPHNFKPPGIPRPSGTYPPPVVPS